MMSLEDNFVVDIGGIYDEFDLEVEIVFYDMVNDVGWYIIFGVV